MDYECDIGYKKSQSGSCQPIKNYESKIVPIVKENQKAQCESFGFFTETRGYRKVPGNKCVGGLDLNPI